MYGSAAVASSRGGPCGRRLPVAGYLLRRHRRAVRVRGGGRLGDRVLRFDGRSTGSTALGVQGAETRREPPTALLWAVCGLYMRSAVSPSNDITLLTSRALTSS
jgi:hypothetical protein